MNPRTRVLAPLWTLACLLGYLASPVVKVEGLETNPLLLPSDAGLKMVSGTLIVGSSRPAGWNLWADDCITRLSIDGNPVHQGECGPCLHCGRSFFAFPQGLAPGPHRFEAEVRNLLGDAYFMIGTGEFRLFEALWLWLFGLTLILAATRLKLRPAITGILLAGMVVSVLYLEATGPRERSYDVVGHLDYVKFIAREGSLPRVDQAWETYQSPLYYVTGALWLKALGGSYPGQGEELILQRLSWLAFLAALLAVAFCWAETEALARRRLHWIGAVLVAGLPAHLFLAARVSNDVFLPFFGAAALAGALAYVRRGQERWLALSGIAAALAVATKLSGLPVAAFALIALWARAARGRSLTRGLALALVPTTLFLVAWEARCWIQVHQLFYDRVWNLDENLKIPNTAWRWLSFDLRAYLSEPMADSRTGSIRFSLPTFFVTSAIQGEFKVLANHLGVLTFLRAFFLGLVAAVPAALWVSGRNLVKKHEWTLNALPAALCLLLVGYYNAKGSFSSSQDFRFCAALFVPFAFLVAFAVDELAPIRGWRTVLRVCSVGFSVLLLVFYWLLTIA